MTTESDKCSLVSLLPMSCRNRAEDFARRLHSKLTSLGQDTVDTENTWLNTASTQCRTNQPKAEPIFDFGPLESPASPAEDATPTNQSKNCCNLSVTVEKSPSIESDSSDVYYEAQNNLETPTNGFATHEEGSQEDEDEEEEAVSCATCSEGLSFTDEATNISSYSDLPQETYTSSLSINQDLTIECPKVLVSQASIAELSSLHDDEAEERTPRVRRCSSLKTGKTPPGTPSQKKIVRFADVLGLDLADVRTFLDEVPKVPTSAFDDLSNIETQEISPFVPFANGGVHKMEKLLVPLFQQPCSQSNFVDRVRTQGVCLESAMVEEPSMLAIGGTVRVRNLDFHKSVHVRYSMDGWQTYADVQATYLANSCDGFSDKWRFLMYGHCLAIGQTLEFAVRFQCKGVQYWDNNRGRNYVFECLPAAVSNAPIETPMTHDSHTASFY